MTIYIDLDDTLIHALPAYHKPNPGKRTRVVLQDSEGNEVYHTMLRPLAHKLLEAARGLSNVKMLTTATKDYAIAHNETFNFGFAKEDIIAREDLMVKITLAYGSDIVPAKSKVDPNSLLIDNLSPTTESGRIKSSFLGIPPEQYIVIREFSGKDPDCFEQELHSLIENMATLIKTKSTTPKSLTPPISHNSKFSLANNSKNDNKDPLEL
jgi:hypothetical protein